MDPLDQPAEESHDQTLTLILALLVTGIGAVLAIALVAGLLGLIRPNCGSFTTNRTGACGTDGYMTTQTAPVIPTFDPDRFPYLVPTQ